jgi:hypothetical protein
MLRGAMQPQDPDPDPVGQLASKPGQAKPTRAFPPGSGSGS